MKFQFKSGSIPIALLVLCGLGFGVLIPILGFYWDDWPAITTIRLLGANAFWYYFYGERPLSAWIFVLLGPLFGTHKLAWHIFTLLMRWVAILSMYWNLRLLWPNRVRQVTWMVMLFAIYPTFTNQPVAVTFSYHWVVFSLYFWSIGLMLLAIKKPRWLVPLNALGVVFSAMHVLTMEYFIGLELLRPFLLWIMLSDRTSLRQRIRGVFLRWLPYLILVIGVVVWRLFFMVTFTVDPNDPVLLKGLVQQPASAIVQFFHLVVQEYLVNFFGAWYTTINPTIFDLTNKTFLVSFILGIISTLLAAFYLGNLSTGEEEPSDSANGYRQPVVIGLVAAFLGSLPVWVTDRSVLTGLQGGRFGLAAMFGIGIAIVGILEWLTPRRSVKIVILSLMIGAAVGFHYRSTDGYLKSWIKQHSFYWQLYWRAPYLKPGTALYSTDELFIYMGRSPTSMALNLLYPQPTGSRELAYWFVELPYHIGPLGIPDLIAGKEIHLSFRKYSYTGSSLNGLAIFYEPEAGRCLWVLSPSDRYNPDIPAMTEDVLPISKLSRIEVDSPSEVPPPQIIFGKEPYHSWCYYYQKADLARQTGDWQEVVSLAKAAAAAGFKPEVPHERLPFIEAYAHVENWAEAIRQTRRAYEKDPRYSNQLCFLWNRIDQSLEIPADVNRELSNLRAKMQCGGTSSSN